MKQIEHNRVHIYSVVAASDVKHSVDHHLPLALRQLKKVMDLEEDEPGYQER